MRPRVAILPDLFMDMQDIKDCYHNLLSAAAATENSAYEFSESLQELGACLLEKTSLSNDEESGKVLLMLGKTQFVLQKLIDNYRSHVVQTISIPSESLLNELQTVEDMKQQCDEKRNVYECMMTKQREKGSSRFGKRESISSLQVQAAHDEYDEKATSFVFRLKSLKQGQSRSLLTQAARHHDAQLCLFRSGLKSLEAIEPHVERVTEQQHIDYHFTELQEKNRKYGVDVYDDVDADDADDDGENVVDDDDYVGELSSDYRRSHQWQDYGFTSQHMMEEDLGRRHGEFFVFGTEPNLGSQSAPLFPHKSSPEKIAHMRSSPRGKLHAYVLPTPANTMNLVPSSQKVRTQNLWHSSPLVPKKHQMIINEKKPAHNSTASSLLLPLPLAPQLNRSSTYSKSNKRQAFSGPILQNLNNARPGSSPFVASPKISELHQLPRPPSNFAKPQGSLDQSGSLLSTARLDSSAPPRQISPVLHRSFSIPLNDHGIVVAHPLQDPTNIVRVDDVISPCSRPILFPIQMGSMHSVTSVSTSEIRDTTS